MATNGNTSSNGFNGHVSRNSGGNSSLASDSKSILYTNEYRSPVPLSPSALVALRAMVEEQATAGRAHAASIRARQGSIGSPIHPRSLPDIHMRISGSLGRSPNMPTSSSAVASIPANGLPMGNALRGGGGSISGNSNAQVLSDAERASLRTVEHATINAQTQAGNYGGGHIPQLVRLDDEMEAGIRDFVQDQAAGERARSASLIAATQAHIDAEIAVAQAHAHGPVPTAAAAAANPQNDG